MPETDPMTVYHWVYEYGGFPKPLYPFQQRAVNNLGPLPRSALYFDVGTGKTLTSLAIAVYKLNTSSDVVLVIVPPVLLVNWQRNIEQLGQANTCTIYRGTVKQRRKLNLNVKFIVVGIQIFKKDYEYLAEQLAQKRVFGIVDEAQMCKAADTDNFRKVRDFFLEQQICLLTGTPISTPLDAYAMIKLVSPNVYKSQYQFESIHVVEHGERMKPLTWRHLDRLNYNLMLSAERVLKQDVLKDLPELVYNPIYYEMEDSHLSLYNQIADDQLLQIGDEKLDFTNVSALFQALLQVPCNAEYFSQGKTRSSVKDLIDNVLDELNGTKLVIFAHYKMTIRDLLVYLKPYGVVGLFGETRDRQLSIDTFVRDPSCRIIVLQIQAGGAGIDGLQDVCSDVLFVELPHNAAQFHQAVARVHRNGQHSAVNVRVAIADQTLMVHRWEVVMERDTVSNLVIRGHRDIRDAIRGRVRKQNHAKAA